VKGSPARTAKFDACVDKECILDKKKLKLNVPTRWNATYLMLKTAEKHELAFHRLEVDDGHYLNYFRDFDENGKKLVGPPKNADFEITRYFSTFLHVFFQVTLKFLGYLFVTSNAYFHELLHIQKNICRPCDSSRDVLLKNMAQKMKAKFDKYWGRIDNVNLMLFVAVVLDPRYKIKYVEF
jgi:hypothetical protein